MNLSPLSKKKLSKSQMQSIMGGNPGYNNYLKKIPGGIWHVQGWSVYNSNTGNWDQIDDGSHWECQDATVASAEVEASQLLDA